MFEVHHKVKFFQFCWSHQLTHSVCECATNKAYIKQYFTAEVFFDACNFFTKKIVFVKFVDASFLH